MLNETLIDFCFNCCLDLCYIVDKVPSDFGYYVGGPFIVILGGVGLLLNIFIIIVVSTQKIMQTLFNKLLSILAIFDSILLMMLIASKLLWQFKLTGGHMLWAYAHICFPVSHVALSGSIGMTVALAFERNRIFYNSEKHSKMTVNQATKNMQFRKWVVMVVLGALATNSPLFVVWEVAKPSTNIEVLKRADWMSSNDNFKKYYMGWFQLLITGILPFGFLLWKNLWLYYSIRKKNKGSSPTLSALNFFKQEHDRKERGLIRTLFVIVVAFIFCNILRLSLNVLELTLKGYGVVDVNNMTIYNITYNNICKNPMIPKVLGADICEILWHVSEVMLVINSSVNVVIYGILNMAFKKYVCEGLPKLFHYIKIKIFCFSHNINETQSATYKPSMSYVNTTLRINNWVKNREAEKSVRRNLPQNGPMPLRYTRRVYQNPMFQRHVTKQSTTMVGDG